MITMKDYILNKFDEVIEKYGYVGATSFLAPNVGTVYIMEEQEVELTIKFDFQFEDFSVKIIDNDGEEIEGSRSCISFTDYKAIKNAIDGVGEYLEMLRDMTLDGVE